MIKLNLNIVYMITKYKLYFLTLVVSLLLLGCASKQNFIDQSKSITKETYTYHTFENEKNLHLDFYQSINYKNTKPLILYVHGGGFSGGARDENYLKNYSSKMAKNGFAVASISYRLTMKKLGFGCNTEASLKKEAFIKASEDISYATKYLIDNKKKFNIDTTKVILVGSSAGAEAILNLAYVYENKILEEEFKYAGVIAMAGAITSIEKISTKRAIPTLLFHGTKDKLVPYNVAPHHYCKKNKKGYLQLYGSKAIANKLKELNTSYNLYTIQNGNHSWNSKPMFVYFREMISFIDHQILQSKYQQKEVVKKISDYTSTDL